jgi:hypothetical protein
MVDETAQLPRRAGVRHDHKTAKKGSGLFFSFCVRAIEEILPVSTDSGLV